MIYRLYISGLGEPANLRAELRRAASLHCMCITSMDQTSLAFSIRMYFPAVQDMFATPKLEKAPARATCGSRHCVIDIPCTWYFWQAKSKH